ncbi:MAG: menaquinone biosynthesis protein [Cyanobacteria bacterium]|nr:menaquinone biosynthesis protein [Cyanobacteriota bacterium]
MSANSLIEFAPDALETETRLGAIGFTNTVPIYAGLPSHPLLSCHYHPPATLNQWMLDGRLDISPVSSAFYLRHQGDFDLLDGLSVSSYGSVSSVLFLSESPLAELVARPGPIPVPDDSETSVALLAYLLEAETGVACQERFLTYPASDYQHMLTSYGCALVIGDRALQVSQTLKVLESGTITKSVPNYVIDLSQEWVNKTGLPFVFAVWVTPKKLDNLVKQAVMTVHKLLLHHRDVFFDASINNNWRTELIQQASLDSGLSVDVLTHYYTHALNYQLDATHQESLTRFDQILEQQALNQQAPQLEKHHVHSV